MTTVKKLKSKKETRSDKKVRKGKKKKPIRIDLQAGFDKSGKLVRMRVFFGPGNFISLGAIDGKEHMSIGETHHGVVFDVSTVGSVLDILNQSKNSKRFSTDSIDGPFDEWKDIKWVSLRFLSQLHPDRLDGWMLEK